MKSYNDFTKIQLNERTVEPKYAEKRVDDLCRAVAEQSKKILKAKAAQGPLDETMISAAIKTAASTLAR